MTYRQLTAGTCALAFSLSSFAAFNTAPPATGAIASGNYRNLASEMGKTDGTAKRNAAWDAMFVTDTTKLYVAHQSDKAYILSPDSNDIRTEGQSWGMTAAVMMNKQTEFDKLWRFAVAYQRNTNGTFKWQLRDTNGTISTLDAGPAPDGELYFAYALLNADARWGSAGSINYYNEGVAVLTAIKNNLMLNNLLRFSPNVPDVIDPSYQIPAFYNYFALRVPKDATYWNNAATAARTFLTNHFASAPSGMPTYLADTSGKHLTGNAFSGAGNPSHYYEYDAWRVVLNVALDAHLWGSQEWHKSAVNTALAFLKAKHNSDGCYKHKYEYGTAVTTNNYCADQGQNASNAVALLTSTNSSDAAFFFDRFWADSFPTSLYRYYGGSLHMLALLHTTGEFKAHMPNSGDRKKH